VDLRGEDVHVFKAEEVDHSDHSIAHCNTNILADILNRLIEVCCDLLHTLLAFCDFL
jgi:demethoxyubiquinone hydroxylase (CLK1/Coq7/Cat5 family)